MFNERILEKYPEIIEKIHSRTNRVKAMHSGKTAAGFLHDNGASGTSFAEPPPYHPADYFSLHR
jgi:hypothetical protein